MASNELVELLNQVRERKDVISCDVFQGNKGKHCTAVIIRADGVNHNQSGNTQLEALQSAVKVMEMWDKTHTQKVIHNNVNQKSKGIASASQGSRKES